jgi:hypothetical protein
VKAATNLTPLLMQAWDAELHLHTDAGDLVVSPKSRLRPELRSSLRKHKAELLAALAWDEREADALVKDGLACLNEFYVEAGTPDFDLKVLHRSEDRINEAFGRRDMFALRIAVRQFVEAGLAAFEAASDRGVE